MATERDSFTIDVSNKRCTILIRWIRRFWAWLLWPFDTRRLFLWPLAALCIALLLEYAYDSLYIGHVPDNDNLTEVINAFHWADPKTQLKEAARELTSRLILEMTELTRTVIATGTILAAFLLTRRYWSGLIRWQLIALSILAIVSLSFYFLFWDNSILPNPYIDGTLIGILPAKVNELTERYVLEDIGSYVDRLVHVALVAVAFALGVVVVRPRTSPQDLKHQQDSLTILLYLSAALVVVHVLVQGATLLRVGSLLPQGTHSEADIVQKLAIAASINTAVFYVLLLLSFHLPPVKCLSEYVEEAFRSSRPEDEVSMDEETKNSWLTKFGLFVTPTQYYLRVATVFSPIIAGIPLTKVLTLIYE